MATAVSFWGTGSYLPERVLSNCELEQIVDTSDEWIVARTGIRERRIVAEGESTVDLAERAGRLALSDAGVNAEELDLVIVASVSHDMLFPSTACMVAHRIGAVNAAAFDLEAGCTGFIYGSSVAASFISNGIYKRVLVIGAEAMSRILDFEDRNTCVLFGDGAGAAVLGPVVSDKGIVAFDLGADGSGAESLKLPAGGSRLPASTESLAARQHYVYMNGKDVFKFAVKIMGESAMKAIEKAHWKKEDVNFLVPHQANIRIIDSALKRLNLNQDKVEINVDRYGNVSSASVPIALDEALKAGRIKRGDKIILVAFGAGLTWGSMAVQWTALEDRI